MTGRRRYRRLRPTLMIIDWEMDGRRKGKLVRLLGTTMGDKNGLVNFPDNILQHGSRVSLNSL